MTNTYNWADELKLFNRRALFHPRLAAKITSLFKIPPAVKVLDVGCAEGDTLYELILQSSSSFHLTLVEPSISVSISSERLSTVSASCISYQDGIENLIAEGQLAENYDLIILSHSIYYLKDRDICVKAMQSLLTDQGCMLIVVRSNQGFDFKLRCLIGKQSNETTRFFESVHVKEILEKSEIGYEYMNFDYDIKIEEAEWRGFVNSHGSNLLKTNILSNLTKLIGHRHDYHLKTRDFKEICDFVESRLHEDGNRLIFKDHIYIIKK